MTIEEKALIWTRRQKGNVLNNKNVDCSIAGYNMAAKEYKSAYKALSGALKQCEEFIDNIKLLL